MKTQQELTSNEFTELLTLGTFIKYSNKGLEHSYTIEDIKDLFPIKKVSSSEAIEDVLSLVSPGVIIETKEGKLGLVLYRSPFDFKYSDDISIDAYADPHGNIYTGTNETEVSFFIVPTENCINSLGNYDFKIVEN